MVLKFHQASTYKSGRIIVEKIMYYNRYFIALEIQENLIYTVCIQQRKCELYISYKKHIFFVVYFVTHLRL
jgi:hypothetical protein